MTLERHPAADGDQVVVEVKDLVRHFGAFTAVDHVSFAVRRSEIFGLLGPNGAGKTTTFRMLCGLLPPTHGTLRVAGVDLHRARAAARQQLGYVAQKFALYGDLSVAENLDFFASAYGLRGARRRERIAWALEQFELEPLMRQPSGLLPGGYKQRLAMAAALLHEPEILFLDEPTSGADPLARREFWRRITSLAEQGVTVIVTTHFMEEAEYCDHVAILDHGRVLAHGTPAEIRRYAPVEEGRESRMEDAFIAIVAIVAVMPVLNRPLYFEVHRLGIFTPRSLDIDVVYDVMIHDLDILLALVDAPVTEIKAIGIPVLTDKVDIAHARLDFASGAVANVTASRVSTERVRKLRFFQQHEYISVDFTRQDALRVRVVEPGPQPKFDFTALPSEKEEPLRAELRSFLDSVRTRRAPAVDGAAGRRALELADRVMAGILEHGRRVQLGVFATPQANR